MYTYISSTVGFRNRRSFSISDFYGMNERAVCHYIWGGLPSVNGFIMPPGILYGLRQSTLLQWSASQRVIFGGKYGNGYCRLGTRTATCDCRWDYQICYPAKEKRKGRKTACMVWENSECDSGSEASVDEIIGLMTDIMDSRSRNKNGRLNAESARKSDSECCCHCRSVSEVRIDDHSRRQEKHLESGSQRRKSNGEVYIRRGERYRRSKRDESSRDDNHVLRKDGSTSSYHSVLSSGDFETSVDEGSLVKHGKVIGELSSGCENRSRSERMGSCKEDVKRIQENRDDRHNVESSTEKIAVRESTSSDDRLRLEAVESDTGWGSIESQMGDIRRASVKENHSKLRIEEIEEHSDNRHHAESLRKRFAARESMKQDDGRRSDVVESDLDRHSMKDSKKHADLSEMQKCDVQRDSSSENCTEISMKNREQISASSSNLVHKERWQFSQKDQQTARQKESRKGSMKFNEISEFHDDNIERPNTQKQLGTRVRCRQEDTSSNSNLIEEERMQNRITEQLQIESRRKSQSHAETSEIHDIDIGRSSSSHKIVKTSVHDREKNSTLALNLVQEQGDQSGQTDQQATRQNPLQTHSGDTERLKSSQRASEIDVNNQEDSLPSVVNLVQEDRRKRYQTDEQVIRQRGSRRQSHLKMTEAHDSDIVRASSSSQMLLKTKPKDQAESSVSGLYLGIVPQQTGVLIQDYRNSQVMVVPPQSQLASRGSKLGVLNANMDSISSNTSAPQEAEMLASPHKLDAGTKMDSMHNDTLGSAHRMESSSTQFVGDFVERLEQEASASQKSSLIPKHALEIQGDLIRFSTGSGTKGPSDEMWDVAGPSSQEPSGAEAPEKGSLTAGSAELMSLTNTGQTVAQRSSRSLWSFIADIVQLRWGVRADSHTSHVKSGAQSSSEESLSSDAYFSGREPENDNDGNVGKGKKGLQKEQAVTKDSAGRPSQRTSLAPIHGSSEMTGSQEERKHIGAGMWTSVGELQQSPLSRDASASGKEDGQIKVQKGNEHIPSNVVTKYSPLPVADNVSSSTGHLEVVTDKGDISEIGIAEERPIIEGSDEASGTDGVDGELKQRKLQRNKQVLRERFDEWEEAFKLEKEQRKTDEMFMKEALIEAKKAADNWEVPVGAVLVQNGKIIARGYNLVEELRDSTAHAEMVCIREASKLLHTWRLAETTLYVTLEPCPMCAGAILQARIDSVVWGAPNKLLGADGSWISLLPGGGEEGRDGPIHPFHPQMTIRRGILATECADIMQQFFHLRRRKNKKSESPPSHLPSSNLPSKFFSKVHDMFSMMFCL